MFSGMETNAITREVIAAAIRIHSILGPGLLESAYRTCMRHEFFLRGLRYQAELPVEVHYLGLKVPHAYRVDFLVEDTVVVELKAVSKTLEVHNAQFLTYLKLAKRPVGLMINFNVVRLRHGIKRMVNNFAS
jgi:GxxExxY protein